MSNVFLPAGVLCSKDYLVGGQTKVDRRGQGEGGWLAKCGRPLGKKNIATIFVRFTQINEIFSFCI